MVAAILGRMTRSTTAKVQRTITPVDGSVYVQRTLASNAATERALDRRTGGQRPLDINRAVDRGNRALDLRRC